LRRTASITTPVGLRRTDSIELLRGTLSIPNPHLLATTFILF
jgi:hypothetical protein